VLPHTQLELAPLAMEPERLLARVVATTVAQRAQTWQAWGDAFTKSWELYHLPRVGRWPQHLVWGILDSATKGLFTAGPWHAGPTQGGERLTALLSHETWPRVQGVSADPCCTMEVMLDVGAGAVARGVLVCGGAGGGEPLERARQLFEVAIEESYLLGLGRYRAAMTKVLDELAPHHRVVLQMLLDGRTEREISVSLRRNRHTLHDHIRIIYSQFQVGSRLDLLRAVEQRIQGEVFAVSAARKITSTSPQTVRS
jgi:DNA-binding CsgD family transcriptional regulator